MMKVKNLGKKSLDEVIAKLHELGFDLRKDEEQKGDNKMPNRKLGRPTSARMSILRGLTTDVIQHEQIETTEARAKEVKAIVDSLIALAVKEKDNFEEVNQKVVVAKKDGKGNKETEIVKSKNGKEFLRVVKETKTEKRQKDKPSRLAARRKIMTKINKVHDEEGNAIDLPNKLFNELAPRYQTRKGGYTQIIKKGQRRGDGAETVILKLV